ncbi:MAG TPA: putative porin [Verrucomicrobiae bacterium]|nr:putative porin [Verrucomicrobiae bacterium]
MKPTKSYRTVGLATIAALAAVHQAHGQSAEALINKLVQKGVLTEKEGKDLISETDTNLVSASKWRLSEGFKNITLFGDVRFRYEYRGADNAPKSGSSADDYYRERFRYAVRVGLKGDLYDNFYYGLRVETSTNPRSPWVTFGDDSNPTPSAKNSDGINIGQAYVGWRPSDWFEMTVGKMPMPLYVTPMMWDSDINPEGAVEKFKFSAGTVDLFANFGQFLYQDTNPDTAVPSSDTFMLAWQVGANAKLTKDISVKAAPVIYNYTGKGTGNGLNTAFVGEGLNGINTGLSGSAANMAQYNQNGINDLLVLETPAEVNFKVGKYNARGFGDFAYNFHGDDRARAAAAAGGPTVLPHAYTGENKAYQVGAAFGNLGLVYGATSKKNTWEARAYWQHIEQYAVDVNIIDSDFFEGRANLEGVYTALAYSFTDSIIGTLRYGYAHRVNEHLGTGGNNPDLPILNPVNQYHLLQLDLTWRF